MKEQPASHRLWIFVVVWIGQLVSLTGSSLTGFALGAWVYQDTSSATAYAIIVFCIMVPEILISPLAGTLVDRWDRRWAIIFSDTGAGLGTVALVVLLLSGHSELWKICLPTIAISASSSFQWPAYSAATAMLVPKEHLGRANGLVQLGQAISYVVPPVLGGLLLRSIEVWGVILIDFATFLFAIVTLLLIRIPRPEPSQEKPSKGSLLREFAQGWTYVAERSGLLGILIVFAFANFLLGFATVLFTPLLLSFTNTAVLGTITSIGAAGMIVGSILMSVWGGAKHHIHALLGCLLLEGLAFILGGLSPSVYLIAIAAFGFFLCFPIVSASSEAIWQSKVLPDLQGRVYSLRTVVAMSSMPIAYLVAGPLADYVFNPLLTAEGALAGSIGRVIGIGQGRGIGLMFIVIGFLTIVVATGGYLSPRVRFVENELPDATAGDETCAAAKSES